MLQPLGWLGRSLNQSLNQSLRQSLRRSLNRGILRCRCLRGSLIPFPVKSSDNPGRADNARQSCCPGRRCQETTDFVAGSSATNFQSGDNAAIHLTVAVLLRTCVSCERLAACNAQHPARIALKSCVHDRHYVVNASFNGLARRGIQMPVRSDGVQGAIRPQIPLEIRKKR